MTKYITLEENIKHLRDEEAKFRRYAFIARTHGFEQEVNRRYSEQANTNVADGLRRQADWFEELKYYKELEEQGRLLVLPCKPDSEVFIIRKRYTKCSHENVPFEESSCLGCVYECDSRKEFYIQKSQVKNILWIVDNIDAFGDTVFLTYEEAEEELVRRMNVL